MAQKKQKSKKTGKIIGLSVIGLLLIGFIIFAIFVIDIKNDIVGKNLEKELGTTTVRIEQGDTTKIIAEKLKENGVIKYSSIFSFMAKVEGIKLQPGSFEFKKGDSYENIMKGMQKVLYRESVTIMFPEGSEVRQIINKLVEKGVGGSVADYEAAISTLDFGYDYLPPAGTTNRLEGYLFPDTYDFFTDDSVESVIKKFLANFDKKIKENDIISKAQTLGMTLNDAVILGSIIEAEGQVNEELPIISSVFHNRLDINMKLQSCATVNYVLPESERSWVLSNAQMKTDSPYNTYLHAGLPPTAVSNPGIASIAAAVSPEDTQYIYFCAKGDGSHAFAVTYAEHEANAKKYLS